jgi:ferrous iron transport protein A
MNAPFKPDMLTLDLLPLGQEALIASIDWESLEHAEACRLKHFGFDDGITVQPLHLGPFGRDPVAVRVGRMTVAIRRAHARAIRVVPSS